MIRSLIVILFFPINAIACSCGDFRGEVTIKDYNNSEMIIVGKAIKVTIDRNESVYKQRRIEFQIEDVFKGKIDSHTVMIYTAWSDATCGLIVKEGEEWLIWAYLRDNVISTSLCTRSRPKKNAAADLKTLAYFKSNPRITEWKDGTGSLFAIGELKNNTPTGYWKYFYKNGFIESEGLYNNGKYDGKWTIYLDPEGIVIRLKNDKKIPEDSMPDLQLLQHKVWQIQYYKNGKGDGEFIRYAYYSTDKPISITNYKEGKADGKLIDYYANGIIASEQNYKDGKLDGYLREYFKNGQLKEEGKYVQDNPVGEFKLYNEAGELIKTRIDKRPK